MLELSAIPPALNGFPVIERRIDRRGDGAIVMCLRLGADPHPYVVARWWPQLGTSWHGGEYCGDASEAAEAYASRDEGLPIGWAPRARRAG